jgi:ATP-binding cassette subfamily F protein uup
VVSLISLRDVELSFGVAPLLDGVTLHLEAGDRVALLGRNGAGKSTLLKLVARMIAPDAGVVDAQQGLRIGMLEQSVPEARDARVREVVAAAVPRDTSEAEAIQRVDAMLSRVGLSGEIGFGELSAGMKRRVMLARALVPEPDLLLLDEPTNHLDLESIQWLEDFLARFAATLLFVTHDRAFLERIATRIVELERGRLIDFPGGYQRFLERRESLYEAEERAAARLDKKLAEEVAWSRQGIKARRTRNMGRMRALSKLRAERRARRDRSGTAKMTVQQAERSGKLVVEADGVSVALGGRTVLSDLSTTILRGDKVGIVGPNGSGKTTLLRALLGRIEPDAGSLRLGTRLEIAYFDQLRAELDRERTVADNITGGGDQVTVEGNPRHVIGYLGDWLFPAERVRAPVSALSGGEQNRLLLARLFLTPSNLLVLDEPTNDLDIETLELLEERLVDYDGTLLVVSHDRRFLDNVVTSTLAYEGDGRFVEYAGGYSDMLEQRGHGPPSPTEDAPEATAAAGKPKTRAKRLSFKEERELEALVPTIEQLESDQTKLEEQLGDPSFYQKASGEAIARSKERLEELARELERAYARWQELEELSR